MNSNILGYAIAAAEIVFASVGFVTGWMSPTESMTVFAIGLSTFGIHHNVASTVTNSV